MLQTFRCSEKNKKDYCAVSCNQVYDLIIHRYVGGFVHWSVHRASVINFWTRARDSLSHSVGQSR